MRKILLLAVIGVGLGLAGCNTVAGAGRDVSSAGKAVTNTADEVRR